MTYYYKVAIYDVQPPFGFFLFRYSALLYGKVLLRSYYTDPYIPPISTVGIVFIVIGSVVFVGIIKGGIIYFYKKKQGDECKNQRKYNNSYYLYLFSFVNCYYI